MYVKNVEKMRLEAGGWKKRVSQQDGGFPLCITKEVFLHCAQCQEAPMHVHAMESARWVRM